MDEIGGWTQVALGIGLESQQMEFWQMALRAVIVYAVTLAMVRLGKKRFMGKATAFDIILGIMLGSIVSRAITGNEPLVPALAATAALIALHSALTAVACRWHAFGEMINFQHTDHDSRKAASGRRLRRRPYWLHDNALVRGAIGSPASSELGLGLSIGYIFKTNYAIDLIEPDL